MRLSLLFAGTAAAAVPLPNTRQLAFMEQEMMQFFHFGINTFWDPPEEYLYQANPTYHDCSTTNIDHGNQTAGHYPCLNPDVFNPTELDCDDWMRNSKAMGMTEICLTAHHEGGFALWPSKYSNYSVAASRWRNGKGDVLREFADAANRWGIKICYYLNVQNNGHSVLVEDLKPEAFIEKELGMLKEVLTEYGPVNRMWFDGTHNVPKGTDTDDLWKRVYEEIRTTSPDTLISPYRGDICSSTGSLYTGDGPTPNSTDTSSCKDAAHSETGKNFYPTEMHGITIQEGDDGNTDEKPTYWFWHPWACAHNKTGCPWLGHGNASRIFDSYLTTVGHGAVLNMNCPADRRGKMNASVAEVMQDVGKALNQTFHTNVGEVTAQSYACGGGVAYIHDVNGAEFDYVVTMEDLTQGQRIANYSVEFQRMGSSDWETLIPVIHKNKTLGDRPDGHDPRDQYVGHKRIDFPIVNTSAIKVSSVRLSCHRAMMEPVNIRSFSLHKKSVPWEN